MFISGLYFCSVQENDQATTVGKVIPSSQAIAEACKFAYNDAKFVNERAKNDIVLLSRYNICQTFYALFIQVLYQIKIITEAKKIPLWVK